MRPSTASFGASTNPTAAEVQTRLNSLGAKLAVDGSFGNLSRQALAAFQSSRGLAATGLPDAATLSALGFVGATGIADSSGAPSANPNQQVLPSQNTPLLPDQAAKALSQGYKEVTGTVPSKDILALLMGQTAVETANWTKMPNYNFGGVKAQSSDPYVQIFTTTEVVSGVTQTMNLKFAAYKTATDGAIGYIKVLLSRPHWAAGLKSGSPESFVAGLTTAPAYFTSNAGAYLTALKSRMSTYIALAEKYAVPIGVGIGGIVLAAGAGFALWYLLSEGSPRQAARLQAPTTTEVPA